MRGLALQIAVMRASPGPIVAAMVGAMVPSIASASEKADPVCVTHPAVSSTKDRGCVHEIATDEEFTVWASRKSATPAPSMKMELDDPRRRDLLEATNVRADADLVFFEWRGRAFVFATWGGVVDEGTLDFSAALLTKTSDGWRSAVKVPVDMQSERMRLIPDVDGDAFPEVLRVEATVPCSGGAWATVFRVQPKVEALAVLQVPERGCDGEEH